MVLSLSHLKLFWLVEKSVMALKSCSVSCRLIAVQGGSWQYTNFLISDSRALYLFFNLMNTTPPKLTIWGRLNSFNVQKVLFLLEELGVEFDRLDAGMAYGVNKTDSYLQMNPNGLVPTLRDEDFILWESHAILRYLASQFDANGHWYGPSLRRRAQIDQWLDWTNTSAWPPMRVVFWGWVRQPHESRNYEELEACRLQMVRQLDILDRELSRSKYVAGEHMSLADIPLSLIAYRWFNLPIERPEFLHVNRWYQLMTQTPGFEKYSSGPLS
jgi:glutathione S-transferase